MKRRHFIQRSALASVGSMLIPNFLKAFEMERLNQNTLGDKKLVIIQWSGGNDGLNTVVPFQNDIYYRERPRLAVPKNEVIKLNGELGLNPVMSGLKSLFDEGYVSIINNVGYPNPDRSHFRSMDIWHSASDSNEYIYTGWLGRYLDAYCNNTDCKTAYEAIEVDDTLSLAMKGEKVKALAVKDMQKLYKATKDKQVQAFTQMPKADDDHENVAYLYKTLAETVSSADYIYEKSKLYKSRANYPQQPFSQQLKRISEFICSGLETSVYYASLSGFDTHVNQKNQQERLLKQYSEGIKAFVDDLKQNNRLNDTVILTFSEFGRRVAQNASGGTDHGTANNVYVMGGNLKKAGIFNENPNLSDLDEGDLKYSVDFRQIYATLLQKQLNANAQRILGKDFKLLDLIE